MQISQEGLALIKKYEGCELEAYLCPAGVLTIGYGHIKNVKEGDTITQEEANDMLLHEMVEYEEYINELVKVELEQYQFDALCSWVFNLGPTNLISSTLLKVLNNKDEVISGSLNQVQKITDVWTFSKIQNKQSSNWLLAATSD